MTQDYRWAARARTTIAAAPSAAADALNPSATPAIKLSGGLGYPPALPDIGAEALVAAALKHEGMQYGPLFGLDDLRDEVVRYLAVDGLTATRENILIVNGAKHGLDLACRVFMEKGDAIIVTAPTYLTAVSILKTHEVEFLSVALDRDGMRVDLLKQQLEERRVKGLPSPKLLFDVPDFHNPTGVTLSEPRRRRLAELAREYGFFIIEDDPYRRVRFEGAPVPPIKSFDTDGHVIGLGTVSKIMAPGLRIGWVNADVEIVRRMAAQKSDHGTNPFVQRIVAQLFASGKVDHHVEELRRILRGHRDIMVAGVEKHLPGATVTVPSGGYFLWVELPRTMDGQALAEAAGARGVEVFAGASSFATQPPANFMRLAYSYASSDEIRRGMELLGQAYRAIGGGATAPVADATAVGAL